jgi:hypothetical protein
MPGEFTMLVRMLIFVKNPGKEPEHDWQCYHEKLLILSLGQWPTVLVMLRIEGMAV